MGGVMGLAEWTIYGAAVVWGVLYTWHLERYGLWYGPGRLVGELLMAKIAILGLLASYIIEAPSPTLWSLWACVFALLGACILPCFVWSWRWSRRTERERAAYRDHVRRRNGYVNGHTMGGLAIYALPRDKEAS